MQNRTKIIIAVSLPLLILIFVIGSVLLPRLFFAPQYDFLYTTEAGCNQYPYCNEWAPYRVTEVGLEKSPLPTQKNDSTGMNTDIKWAAHYPTIYLYHSKTDSFNEISFVEAAKLDFAGNGSAPDGTIISSGYRSRGLFGEIFGGSSYNNTNLYLKNGAWTKAIEVGNSSGNNYYDAQYGFKLISWINHK